MTDLQFLGVDVYRPAQLTAQAGIRTFVTPSYKVYRTKTGHFTWAMSFRVCAVSNAEGVELLRKYLDIHLGSGEFALGAPQLVDEPAFSETLQASAGSAIGSNVVSYTPDTANRRLSVDRFIKFSNHGMLYLVKAAANGSVTVIPNLRAAVVVNQTTIRYSDAAVIGAWVQPDDSFPSLTFDELGSIYQFDVDLLLQP